MRTAGLGRSNRYVMKAHKKKRKKKCTEKEQTIEYCSIFSMENEWTNSLNPLPALNAVKAMAIWVVNHFLRHD